MSPFKALYGRDPLTLLSSVEEESKIEKVNVLIREHNAILDELKENLQQAQNRMEKFANRKRREVHFEVGDHVFLKFQPYRFCSLATRPNKKLNPHLYEPYEIVEKVGTVAYRLSLPPIVKIHPVFHVS